MFGFIIGTLCLIALIATFRRGRYGGYGWGWQRYAPAYGYDDGPGYEPPPWRRGYRSRRGLLRGLFGRLDTTPGQEKAIVAILERTGERLRELKAELRAGRKELAALIGSETLERPALEALRTQHRPTFDRAGAELSDALLGLHEVLDARQRRILSELLADGSLGLDFTHRGC